MTGADFFDAGLFASLIRAAALILFACWLVLEWFVQ